MARPRSAEFDGQREQILATAAALFARQGYAGATMNALAQACGLSKATLYHYVRDKPSLLAQISLAHVQRLESLVAEVDAQSLMPAAHLRALIERFMAAYAGARNEHRVLTEDVKFLDAAHRQAVLDGQRRVVEAFSRAVLGANPELGRDGVAAHPKVLSMLLFGMINWTHTWLKPGGPLTHARLAPIVSELFISGLQAVAATERQAALNPDTSAAPGRRARRERLLA